ncbi:MAG: protein translocase subunit SecD [Kiloniellales bacterium]
MVYFAKWLSVLILVVCGLGLIYAAPNLMFDEEPEDLPFWVPHKQVTLGLDLQGGSHLLLEVDTAAVIRERLEGVVDSLRTTLRRQKIGYTGLGVDGEKAVFRVRDPAQADEAGRLAGELDPTLVVEEVADGAFTVAYEKSAAQSQKQSAVEQSIEVVRRRVDEFGTVEPTIQRQGTDRILVQVPGLQDPERLKAIIGKTAKLTFRFVDEDASLADALRGRVPPGSEVLPSDEVGPDGQPRDRYVVRKRVMVSGETLIDSQPTYQEGQPVVSFRFDSVGARRFGDATRKNVGRLFAIVLDNKVISAPVIREPILGGSGIISGRFLVQEAQDLALLLRAGALPAPLVILEERTVGPGLGQDSIDAGKIAAVIGLIFVAAFMVVTYGLFGLMADVALMFNIALIVAILSVMPATLTLPGIAGIVLTMGMAVDANVLVFERIREEVRIGRTPINAIDAGYERALKTIIDSNLTTLFAAIILFLLGSGPISGFAVTLMIGICTSMFTAIMVTRLMVVTWLRATRPSALPI